jgi:hypothetical protein
MWTPLAPVASFTRQKSLALPTRWQALAVRDNGVGGARGTRVAELDASAEAVGDGGKEGLARAGGHLPSHRPTLKLAQLCWAAGIVRLHAEPTQGFAALLDCALNLGPETVAGQGAGLDAIEPDRSRMADLGLERKRLLANEESVADRSVPLPLRELLEQVGRHLPAVGRLGDREAHALEFA